jgi:lysozyme family protein
MASFEIAVNLTLQHEGSYQANPKDKGNYNSKGVLIGTNYGISAPTLENYLNYPPTAEQMKILPRALAEKIYRSNYWDNYRLSDIVSQQVANQLFDINVLQGPSKMADIAQDALNKIGYSITNDKSFGPKTRELINKAIVDGKKDALNNEMVRAREVFLASDYWTGWLTRAKSFFVSTSQEESKKKI